MRRMVPWVSLMRVSLILSTCVWAQSPDHPQFSSDVLYEAEQINPAPLPLSVPENRRSNPIGGSGLISTIRLRHKVPGPARKQFEQGLKAKNKGRTDESIRRLTGAIRLDPLYWEAHAQLADLYWQTEEKAAALECLEAALAIDPNSDVLQSNKAVALLDLGRPAEAEVAARHALQLSPQSAEGNYLLALAILRQGKVTSEAAEHLKLAVGRIPQAQEIFNQVSERLFDASQLH